MKKFCLLAVFLCFGWNLFCQVEGSFKVINNNWCFVGENTTRSTRVITAYCVNDAAGQQIHFNYDLRPGNHFVIGPNQGWNWQNGERLVVLFSDGSRKAWTFDQGRRSNPAPSPAPGPNNNTVVVCPMCMGNGCSSCSYCGQLMVTPNGVFPYGNPRPAPPTPRPDTRQNKNQTFCNFCHGTGLYCSVLDYAPYYGGHRVATWCNICQAEKYPHTHSPCPSCSGGRR